MATTRKEIINQLIDDFKNKFNKSNNYMDIIDVYRGSVFSEDILQFPCLSIDFMIDTNIDGDFLDDNSIRSLTLSIQGAANTSSNNFDEFDDLVEYTEEFLRSGNCSYNVEIGEILKLENVKSVSTSYFSIQIVIRYDRQY